MLKRDITYTDYNDKEVTKTFYFNLSKAELMEMEMGIEGGLSETLKRIVETKDTVKLIMEFKRLILASYGVKSDDGERFVKNEKLREEFSQSAAYSVLFMDLATSDEAAALFINGVIPKDLPVSSTPQVGGVVQIVDPQDPAFQAMRAAAASSQAVLPPTPSI